MKINLPSTIHDLLLCGDIHGNLEYIKHEINSLHLTNSCIIVCGDIGLGFQPKWEENVINFINKKLVEKNCYILALRGNHKFFLNFFVEILKLS